MVRNNIGAKIKKLRTNIGWTQLQLAEKLGVDQGHVSNLERGIKSLTMDMLTQLSEVFNVPTTYFVATDEMDIVISNNKDGLVLQIMKEFLNEGIQIDSKVIDVISKTIDSYYKKL